MRLTSVCCLCLATEQEDLHWGGYRLRTVRLPSRESLANCEKVRYKGGMETTKWQYFRDDIATLDEVDAKLKHWGALGWELVTILHANEVTTVANENILAPEVWMLIFKQPVV